MAGERKAAGMREALEGALVADPDDLSAHMAYGDWLGEQDDPADRARGEFIAVQLALEDATRPAKERERLKAREAALLAAHQREWLGGLAPFLLDGHTIGGWATFDLPAETPLATCTFRRGWLHTLQVNYLPLDFARALKDAPATRLLRELVIEYIADDGDGLDPPPLPEDDIPDGERWAGLHPLRGSTTLANVRHFRLGPDQGDDWRNFRCYVMSHVTPEIVGLMPRLEELYLWCNDFNLNDLLALPTLSNLRVLLVYHAQQVHRLQMLDSPTFRNLEKLCIHPHQLSNMPVCEEEDEALGYARNDGYLPLPVVRALVRSKHLARLTHLQLRCSTMGDEGVREIADSRIFKRLKWLDLRHGRVTDAGVRYLARFPAAKRLTWLDLDRNALTAEGQRLLASLGVLHRAASQLSAEVADPGEDTPARFLYEGEFE